MNNDLKENEPGLLALLEALIRLERDFKLDAGFNFFDAVGIVRQEIRHSRFLAFLLDPNGAHGFSESFLRAFLTAAVAGHPEPLVSRLAVAVADLSNCLVHCERDHFDITVEVPSLKLLFVVENKIDAVESPKQLENYRQLAMSRYRQWQFMGTFLTVSGYEGQDEKWGVMSYVTITTELKQILERVSVASDVAFSIAHYIQLIERRIMASQDLIDACKQIYRQHRVAIDLLIQYGQESQLSEAFKQFKESHPQLKETAVRSNTVFFLFESWQKISNYPRADRKQYAWSSDFPILLWFETKGRNLYLRLEVGPFQDVSLRSHVVKDLQTKLGDKKLKEGGKGNGANYTRIITKTTSVPDDPTVDDLSKAMETVWKTLGGEKYESEVQKIIIR
jgi:hypothetical protein